MKLSISIIALAAMFAMVAATPMAATAPAELIAGSHAASTPGEILDSAHAANTGHLTADSPETPLPTLNEVSGMLVGVFTPKGAASGVRSPQYLRKTAEVVTQSAPGEASAKVLATHLNTLAGIIERQETPTEAVWKVIKKNLSEYLTNHPDVGELYSIKFRTIQHQEFHLRQQALAASAAAARAREVEQTIYRLSNLVSSILHVLPKSTTEQILQHAQEIEMNGQRELAKQQESSLLARHGSTSHTYPHRPEGSLFDRAQEPSPYAHKTFNGEPDSKGPYAADQHRPQSQPVESAPVNTAHAGESPNSDPNHSQNLDDDEYDDDEEGGWDDEDSFEDEDAYDFGHGKPDTAQAPSANTPKAPSIAGKPTFAQKDFAREGVPAAVADHRHVAPAVAAAA